MRSAASTWLKWYPLAVLRRVGVRNFKAIGPKGVYLDMAPLTLLVGPNGAGKSSVLEAAALLAQTTRPMPRFGLNPQGRLIVLDVS